MDSEHWTCKKILECEKIVYMNTSFYAIKWDIFGNLCMTLYDSDKLSFKETSKFLLPFLPPNHDFLFSLRVSFYLLMRGKSCSGAEKHSKIKRTLWLPSLETVKRCEMMSEYTRAKELMNQWTEISQMMSSRMWNFHCNFKPQWKLFCTISCVIAF